MEPSVKFAARLDSKGRWLPPKKLGSNIPTIHAGQTMPVDLNFFHTGTTTNLLNERQAIAMHSQAHLYKTCSIYSARGVFWTVDYDATHKRVGDGKHHEGEPDMSGESDEEDNDYDDWTELSFGRIEGHQSLSYAGRHLPERRLLAQRRDQAWAQHLIPDRYQSHITSRDRRHGGLVGDLPILVGLAAMSLPVSRWHEILPQTITNPNNSSHSWRISQAQLDDIDRGSQCLSF